MQEVQALRQQLAITDGARSDRPKNVRRRSRARRQEERLEVLEQRTQDLAQTKVEASQRLPISLTGMLLFNAFWNGASAEHRTIPPSPPKPDTPYCRRNSPANRPWTQIPQPHDRSGRSGEWLPVHGFLRQSRIDLRRGARRE